jgi:hypothetical protein
MRQAGYEARPGEIKNLYRESVKKSEVKEPLGRQSEDQRIILKMRKYTCVSLHTCVS